MSTEIPVDIEGYAWPDVDLDPVDKMRAMAAGLPHVAVDETVFELPFERLWNFIADLEANVPRFEGGVRQLSILERNGDRMRITTRTPIGLRVDFDCILRSGWCVMNSPDGQVGMAARPEGPNRTRFIHFEGSNRFGRLLRPLFAWNIRQDFRRLRSLA